MKYTCHVCEKEAVGRLSPDMDLKGIPFCETHRDDMYAAYLTLLDEGMDWYDEFMATYPLGK